MKAWLGGGSRRAGDTRRLLVQALVTIYQKHNVQFRIQSEDWGVEESCCVLRLKVVNLFVCRFLQWNWKNLIMC